MGIKCYLIVLIHIGHVRYLFCEVTLHFFFLLFYWIICCFLINLKEFCVYLNNSIIFYICFRYLPSVLSFHFWKVFLMSQSSLFYCSWIAQAFIWQPLQVNVFKRSMCGVILTQMITLAISKEDKFRFILNLIS